MRSKRTQRIILAGAAALGATLFAGGCGWHSVSVRHGHGYHGPRPHHRGHHGYHRGHHRGHHGHHRGHRGGHRGGYHH